MTTFNIDPKSTRVLLIGTGDYEDQDNFENIPQIKNNLQELRRVFSQASILGAFDHNIIISHNQRDEDIFLKISSLCDDSQIKTLIIYYAGHSCVTTSGDFYLTAKNSRKSIIQKNGIHFNDIKCKIKEAKADQVLFLLDTCQSGRVSLRNERDFWLPRLHYTKTWMLTSSPQHRPSFYSPLYPFTYFTGALIKVLNQGVNTHHLGLDLKTVHRAIQDELAGFVDKNLPKPGYWSNTPAKLVAFRNRWGKLHTNPQELKEMKESSRVVAPPPKRSGSGFLLIALSLLFGIFYLLDLNTPQPLGEDSAMQSENIEALRKSTMLGTWEDQYRTIQLFEDNTFTYINKATGAHKSGKFSLEDTQRIQLDCPRTDWHYLMANVEFDQEKLAYQDWHHNPIVLHRSSFH